MKHLTSCLGFNESKDNAFVIKIEGSSTMWIYVLVPEKRTLLDLDGFLRDLWLECCGHLSEFNIFGIRYEARPDRAFGGTAKSMNVKIDKALSVGTVFEHTYDYGSSTDLRLEVVGQISSNAKKETLLMRNEAPEYPCGTCEAPALSVCSCCYEVRCKACAKKKPCCDDDYYLPMVNSPRAGVCGYTG